MSNGEPSNMNTLPKPEPVVLLDIGSATDKDLGTEPSSDVHLKDKGPLGNVIKSTGQDLANSDDPKSVSSEEDEFTEIGGNKKHKATDAQAIAAHYNSRPNVGVKLRSSSSILKLRNFNNWVKSVLIREYADMTGSSVVLDLACGKGGDLPKWKLCRLDHLYGFDIAEQSIEHAKVRFSQLKCRFKATFVPIDAFSTNWDTVPNLPKDGFDAISCQFAYHYSFESKNSAQTALDNIAAYLKPNGYFFGTIPDASVIKKRLYKANGQSESLTQEISNRFYTIKPDSKSSISSAFGARYYFTLVESVTDCPEYLVTFPILEQMAEERGLELIQLMGFPAFYAKYSKIAEYFHSLLRMNVTREGDSQLFYSEEEKEVAGKRTELS